MTNYKVLSEEMILKYQKLLSDLVKDIIKNPTDASLRMFIVQLYEYMQYYVGYKYKLGAGSDKVSVTHTDIKKNSNVKTESESLALNRLYSMANSLRHDYLNSGFESFLLTISTNSKSYSFIWDNYLKEVPDVKLFLEDKYKITVLYKELYDKEKTYISCRDIVYPLLKSGMILGDIVLKISRETLYSESLIKRVIFDILKDTYVDEGTLA